MKREVQLEPPVSQNLGDSDPLLDNQEKEEEEEKEEASPGSTSEIRDEDVEAGLLPCCRICLESDSDAGEKSCTCFYSFMIHLVMFRLQCNC